MDNAIAEAVVIERKPIVAVASLDDIQDFIDEGLDLKMINTLSTIIAGLTVYAHY